MAEMCQTTSGPTPDAVCLNGDQHVCKRDAHVRRQPHTCPPPCGYQWSETRTPAKPSPIAKSPTPWHTVVDDRGRTVVMDDQDTKVTVLDPDLADLFVKLVNAATRADPA